MTREDLLAFLRRHRWGVQSSTGPSGAPQAAVVGIVVSDALEIFFDTLDSTRKCANLRRDRRIAFVVGWDEEQTAQIEGVADEPEGDDLERLRAIYFERFPDGRERAGWPGITYFRVRPTWIRHSDFRGAAPKVVELAGDALGSV
jgi:pyridoxamine 5'-phosphate oxidase-like protein